MSLRHRFTHLSVLTALALGLLFLPERPAAAAGKAVPGAVTDLTWGTTKATQDRTIKMLRDAGVKWVRANVNWKDFEPDVKGTLNPWWVANVDYAVKSLRAAGIQVLMPIADGVPYWASADPSKHADGAGRHWNQYWRPTNNADYADFVRTVVARYAPMGVHAYEIWNEPNYSRFWPSGPNPADYVALLRPAYAAVKSADPTATVVLGGLSQNDYGFLAGIYQAGGKAFFDVAAVHPYPADPTTCWKDPGTDKNSQWALCGLDSVRSVMVANGDAAKVVWLTEFGWSTCWCTGGVTGTVQATNLTTTFSKLADYPFVTMAFYYNFRNNFWQNNSPHDIEANYGLLTATWVKKPAYTAYRNYARTVT